MGSPPAFITALNGNGPTTQRVRESNDAQLISAFLVRDAQAAGGSNPATGGRNDDLGVSLNDDGGCTTAEPTPTLVMSFKWTDIAPSGARTMIANYFSVQPHHLVRTLCTGGTGLGPTLGLAGNIERTTASCLPSCDDTDGSGRSMPETVSLQITSTNVPENSPTPFTYTVTASLRPDAQHAPGPGTANPVPLLVLGSGNCDQGATGLTVADAANVNVYGDAVVDAVDESSGACRAINAPSPAATFTAANVWLLDSGTPPRGTCAGGHDPCPQVQKFTNPVPDPLADSATGACSGPSQAHTASDYPPGIYTSPVSISGTATIHDGIYYFCGGVTVTGAGTTVNPADPVNDVATWYSPHAPVVIERGGQANPSRVIAETVTVTGTDSGLFAGTKPPEPLSVEPGDDTNLPNWTINRPYPDTTLKVTGGSGVYGWSVTGLPNGLSLTQDPNDGSKAVISGTPTQNGLFEVVVRVADSFNQTKTLHYHLSIGDTPAIDSSAKPHDSTVDRDYRAFQLVGTGGTTPYKWRIDNPSEMPPGLHLDQYPGDAGLITGTPTRVGTYRPTFSFVDAAGAAAPPQTFTITINPKPSILPLTLPDWTVGVLYPITTAIGTGGTAPFTWTATGLPSGLSIDPDNGRITGTATLTGTSTVSITLEDWAGASYTVTLPLRINRPVGILTPELANGEVTAAYDQRVEGSGGVSPYSWTQVGLPQGLSLNPTNRQSTHVRGTPAVSGAFAPTLTVQDRSGTRSSHEYSLTIVPTPTITAPAALQPWTVNRNYPGTQIVTRDGTAPFTWSASGLPPGMAINGSTGVITGEPTSTGSYTVVVRATDAQSVTATQTYNLVINPQPTITTASMPNGQQAIAYDGSLAVAQGTPPFTWAASGLPGGLTIDPASGQRHRHADRVGHVLRAVHRGRQGGRGGDQATHDRDRGAARRSAAIRCPTGP